MTRWYIIDSRDSTQRGVYDTEQDAFRALADLVFELSPFVENPYLIEPGDENGPQAYAIPAQPSR